MPSRAAVDFLLAHGCPSIQYRLRLELLNQSPDSIPMRQLQALILEDPAVQALIRSQQPDGWLGKNFHGFDSLEAGIRLLCEKGVDRSHPALANALRALEAGTDRLENGIGKAGKILDQLGLTGPLLIRSVVFSYAGIENKSFIQDSIRNALDAFYAVAAYPSLDAFTDVYKGKRVIRHGLLWPGLYHLRLLALTQSWRTPETIEKITSSVNRIYELFPLPDLYARHRSQLVAPASLCSSTFDPSITTLEGGQWMLWFHRMEMLARLGIIHRVPLLEKQVSLLKEMLDAGGGKFLIKLNHEYFRKWGAYTGLMLERDWKDASRRVSDLTFRSLLILHYHALWKGREELS